MGKTVAAIIQARMGSTRLPGKVLKKVLDEPLLFYLISQLNQTKTLSEIMVATTVNSKDKEIVDYCIENNIRIFRGSEEDVLDRYLKAARSIGADVIVRITADCPLSDPKVIDLAVNQFLKGSVDFVSNTVVRTFPRGLDVEVFSFEALEKANQLANPQEREHVTLAMIRNPDQFKIENIVNPIDFSYLRLTVDTAEDFRLVSKIIETLYPINPKIRMKDIVQLLARYPDWLLINQHIRQKEN